MFKSKKSRGIAADPSTHNTNLDYEFQALTPTLSKRKLLFYSLQSHYNQQSLEVEITKLGHHCGLNSAKGSVKFMAALGVLEKIAYRTPDRTLQRSNVEIIMQCCLILVRYAFSRVRDMNAMQYIHMRRIRQADMNYFRVIWKLTPGQAQEIIEFVVAYLSDWELWNIEFMCLNLIRRVVFCHVPLDMVLQLLLSTAESHMSKNWTQSRSILHVMYELLQFGAPRCSMAGMVNLAEKLLNWLYDATCASEKETLSKLQRSLEVCARRALERFDDDTLLDMIYIMLEKINTELDDEQIMDYGGVLEYATLLYRTGLYVKTLHEGLMEQLFSMMTSRSRVISLTGCRVLQRFLDRHNNLFSFVSPQLYLENLSFDIVVGSFRTSDKLFLVHSRAKLHEVLLEVIRKHGSCQVNLESVNNILSLLAVEIPCGFTAAFVVCVAMDLQAEANNLPESESREMSWRHATVVGLMTLVCWTHHTVALYRYIESVIARRGRQAPHLNPPLKSKYIFATHHVRWQKPELFFEPWELRYALWKHFRCKNVISIEE